MVVLRRGVAAVSMGLAGLTGAVLTATPAEAATIQYSVAGAEIAATHTVGTFVGTATAPGYTSGTFEAVVTHEPLPTQVGGTSAITGGSLWLRTWSPSAGAQTVTGTFTGGTITLENAGAGCINQTYAVAGDAATTAGRASFDVILTHYRALLFGTCVSYAATVTGALTVGG